MVTVFREEGEEDPPPFSGEGGSSGLVESRLVLEAGLTDPSVVDGLLEGLPRLLLLVPLPQVDMTVGTLTNASTSEANVELQPNATQLSTAGQS